MPKTIRRGVEFQSGYTVTDEGEVYSTKKGYCKKLQPFYRKEYPHITTVPGRITRSIHRLVASFFVPNPDKKPDVNHIDGNPDNPHYSNLEWVTHKENCRKGKGTVLTAEEVEAIKNYPKIYGSGKYLANKYGVSYNHISDIRRGKKWS